MKKTWIVMCLLLCSMRAWASDEKMSYIAPSKLANTNRNMNTAGFWVSQHPSPDALIMSSDEIVHFNQYIQNDVNLTKDNFAVTDNFKTEALVTNFEKIIAAFTEKGYYSASGVRDDQTFIDDVKRNMNLSGVVLGIVPRYGVIVHYADVRFFPTTEGLYESVGDFDFDQIQNSTLDVGSAVAVVHQSADKKWYYVLSALSDGWVPADHVALGDAKVVKDFVERKDFVVALKPKADIFLDEAMTKYYDYVRMGTRLPMVGGGTMGKVKILIPSADKDGKLQMIEGFMAKEDVHKGYLPYTPRTIYKQAFAMLNQPYGWGGMYGEQDCSAFLDEVYSTVGIILPRDSKDQALAAPAKVEFNDKTTYEQKIQALKELTGGTAILPMKGHIMLYLGMIDNRPYVIQDLWAYRERKADKDIARVINRVVVSDMSLGEGSQKGALLKRLTKIIEIK